MKKVRPQTHDTKAVRRIDRRTFVKQTAAASAALAAGTAFLGGQPPAYAKKRKLHYLQWSSFIPDADVEVQRQAKEFEKATGVKVTVELINQNDMPARATAAIESGKGADIMLMIQNQPHLYAKGLEDHNKLVDEVLGDDVYPFAKGATTVDGVSRGVPIFMIGNAVVYRKDIFKEAGVEKAPNTWEEYLAAGKKLKAINMPVGQTLGHTFGDAPSFCYPLMWSFGGMEVDEKGKVVVNSKATRTALEFIREFWEAACDPGGFAWDDTSNNRAFLGQTISATLNGASIYFVARRSEKKYPGFYKKLDHFLNPEGPAGRFHTMGPRTLSIMKYSEQKEAAADYIRYAMQDGNFEKFMVINNGYVNGVAKRWEKHDMWKADPAISIFSTMPRYGRHYGHAGPWNRASGEAAEKYIVVSMFAKAARGEKPADVAAWAEKELKNVYG